MPSCQQQPLRATAHQQHQTQPNISTGPQTTQARPQHLHSCVTHLPHHTCTLSTPPHKPCCAHPANNDAPSTLTKPICTSQVQLHSASPDSPPTLLSAQHLPMHYQARQQGAGRWTHDTSSHRTRQPSQPHTPQSAGRGARQATHGGSRIATKLLLGKHPGHQLLKQLADGLTAPPIGWLVG